MKSLKENTTMADPPSEVSHGLQLLSKQKQPDEYNPQQYARSKMDFAASFDVHKKCVHKIKKCRHCHIIPLINHKQEVVSHFVEHRDRKEKIIHCTIGNGSINRHLVQRRVNRGKDDTELAMKILEKLKNSPEMALEDDDESLPPLTEAKEDTKIPVPSEVQVDPALKRMHNEGSVITEPDTTDHLESSLGSQLEQVKAQMQASFSTPVVKQAARSLEQLVLLVIGLQYDTSLEAIVTRCITFLSAITEGGIILTLKDSLMRYAAKAHIPALLKGKTLKEAFEVEQSQPGSPEMLSADSFKIWETLKQGIFTKHVSYILGTVFAFSACKIKNIKFSHPIYDKVVEHASSDEIDGIDLIDHAIKLYNWTSTVGMACLQQRSLEPLLINSSTLAKCHEKYYYWNKKFLDFKRGEPSSMEERQLMFVEVETIQNTLERFVSVQKEKFLTLQASSLFKEVLALYNDVRDFVQKIDRVKVAMGYHLNGEPKVGKSTFAPILAEAICLARGVEYRKEDNAQINLMAPYQDELNNATQIVTINETLPIKEHLAKSVENAYNTSLALVDSVPYHPNRSNLEDKAKITMQHVGVISTGNTPQPFLNVAKTKGAWERRYPIIDMTVKDEYADDFGRLDSSKTDGSNDYHWYDVYEIIYTKKERVIAYYEWEGERSVGLTTSEVLELVRKQCIDHFAEQDKLDKEHTSKKKKGCLVCKRLAMFCKCPNKDDYTLAGVKVTQKETDADSVDDEDEVCAERTVVGPFKTRCDYDLLGNCRHCSRRDPNLENEPEMGIVSTVASTAGSLVWSSVLPWVNPFIKFQWLWSIDNKVMRCMHEELVEELKYWPEVIGCSAFKLIPEHWEKRANGSLTWFGKRKDQFLKMVAAENQIFLPLSYLLRRALCWGILSFFVLVSFGYLMERLGVNPREYDTVVLRAKEYTEFGWYYPFPQFSSFVFQRRELYAEMGIYTERYVDWQKYYVNIYFFEKILGYICFPWWFTFTRYIPVIETRMYVWWLMPIIMSACISVGLFLFMWWRRAIGFSQRYEDLKKRSTSDPNFQRDIYERSRRHATEYNCIVPTAVGAIGAIVTGLVIWNSMRAPEAGIDSAKRTSWNDWISFNRQVPEPFEAKNSSSEEGQNLLVKSLTSMVAEVDGNKRSVIGTYLEPGILLAPRHFFKRDPYKNELMEYLDVFMETNGVKHKCRIYKENLQQVAAKDAVVVKITRAPKIAKSIKHLLPKKTGTDFIKAKLIFLQKKKDVSEETVTPHYDSFKESLSCNYEKDIDCAGFSVGRGVSYLSKFTKDGFCGSVLVADRRDGAIIGFHIAGKPYGLTSRRGYAQEILYSDYCEAVERLKDQPGFTNQPEMRNLELTRLGMDLITGEGPHPKTEMFKVGAMDPYPCMQVVGHNLNLPRYRSRVRRSSLSPMLEKHCNQKCRWKAPYLKEPWKHHNKNLKRIAKGAWEVPPASLRWARDDYWNQLLPVLEKHIKNHPDLCRPLTLDEAINGHADSCYMRAFKMDTSAGIPNGSKLLSGLFSQLPDYSDGRKRYELTPKAQMYYDNMLACFDRGESIGVYVRTCLKDEVVAEESEKVRIFYILECLFGILCRMYYLPIAEFLSRHPIESECMVGVNCAGPEWEALVSHINELATDGRLNDWDFSGYDLCRSADVMCTSLNLQSKIGEKMCYTQMELHRMEMIGEELRCPLVNWNGTLIFMYIWCSGNSMTVYGNSIENSLHQRISFHWNGTRLRGDDFYLLGAYQDNEHIATYGDDGHGGSKPSVRDITCFSSRKMYFDMIDMGFTNASKDADAEETVDSKLVDFLKRRSVYHESLGLRVGALTQESIWKMGHMSSGVGEDEDLALAAIQTMLHEAFLHGDTFYEYLRTRLKLCAEELNIWTRELDVPFYEKTQLWLQKYGESR